jgi:hypothetical protein
MRCMVQVFTARKVGHLPGSPITQIVSGCTSPEQQRDIEGAAGEGFFVHVTRKRSTLPGWRPPMCCTLRALSANFIPPGVDYPPFNRPRYSNHASFNP